MNALGVAGIAAVITLAGTLIAAWVSRRSEREANEVQEELSEFQILRGTVDALNTEVNRLSRSLDEANTKAELLNRELNVAQANIRILSAHIRQYVPEVPFPALKAMNDLG